MTFPRLCLLLGAGAVAVLGLIIGFVPVTSGAVGCGSAFAPANPFTLGGAGTVEACDAARAGWQYAAWVLIGAGAAALVFALFVIFDSGKEND